MKKIEAIRVRAAGKATDHYALAVVDRAYLLKLVDALQVARTADANYCYSLVKRSDPIRTLAAVNKADEAVSALLEQPE